MRTVSQYLNRQNIMNIKQDQKSPQKSKKSKSLDKRHLVGSTYQIEFLLMLRDNDILPKEVQNETVSFKFEKQTFDKFSFIDENETSQKMEEHNDEDELKQVCSKLFKLNNKDYFQAEFDVAPHKLKNYIDFRDKLKKLQLSFYENILGAKFFQEKKQYICVGQIKRNFFNPQQIMGVSFLKKQLPRESKIGIFRTGQITRKIWATEKYVLQKSKEVLQQKLGAYSEQHMCKAAVDKKKLVQGIAKHVQQEIVPPTIMIILFINEKNMNQKQFLNKLGDANVKFLKIFAQKHQVVLSLVVLAQLNDVQMLSRKMQQKFNKMQQRFGKMLQRINDIFKILDKRFG